MTFQANIPLGSDLISNSQSDILNNFQAIGTVYPTDHVDFNASGAGFHQRVTFNKPISPPAQVAPITTLFTQPAPLTSISDLYYQVGALPSDVTQVTGGGVTTAAYVSIDGATGATIAGTDYNILSTTRTGVGTYQITFTRNFASAAYVATVSPIFAPGTGRSMRQVSGSKATNTYTCVFQNQTNATNDAVTVDFVFFGKLS